MSLAIICFIVCIPLSGLIPELSMQSIVIVSIVLAIIFFNIQINYFYLHYSLFAPLRCLTEVYLALNLTSLQFL